VSPLPHGTKHDGWCAHILLEDRRELSTHLSSISSTFFVNLLNRLGVRPPPPDGFDLINMVQPVTLVDSDIVLAVSSSSQLLDLPFSAGYTVAPAANLVLADGGAQPFGNYLVQIMAGTGSEANGGTSIIVARRNAANAADIWTQAFALTSQFNGGSSLNFQLRITLQANERIVVRNGLTAGTALVGIQSNIWLTAG